LADFDKKIAEALENDETFQALIAQLKEAATSEKTMRFDEPCPNEKCNCKHIRVHKVPNYELKMKIIEFLANRGVGRPAQAESSDDSEKIVFVREVRK
jgi:hypothetical protein